MKKNCKYCGKEFNTIHNDDKERGCYRCTLKNLIGKYPPEEGDFNTAMIQSGEMTEQEQKWLDEDLRNVELGRSRLEPYEPYPEDDCPWMNRW